MAADVAEEESEDKKGFFARLKSGLSKTRSKLSEGLQDVFLGAKSLDDELMEDIEAILLSSDVGVTVTQEILDELTQKISRKELTDGEAVFQQLQAHLTSILKPVEQVFEVGGASPFVILMVGVNLKTILMVRW